MCIGGTHLRAASRQRRAYCVLRRALVSSGWDGVLLCFFSFFVFLFVCFVVANAGVAIRLLLVTAYAAAVALIAAVVTDTIL